MAFAARHDVTADEYFALTDQLPRFTELVDGEVIVNAPSVLHQHIVMGLCRRLLGWIEAGPGRGQCGIPSDVQVDQRNVYAPDIWWCREDRKPGLEAIRLPELPDLAVEVLSPSTRRYDLGNKRARYEALGLPELWIIDPKRQTAMQLRRSSSTLPIFDTWIDIAVDDQLESPQLPDFAVRLADLFGA
ncbi:MAG: Uma2 family endonuclease [Acidimicrobiales bacterium]